MENDHQPTLAPNFSIAFEQMCVMAAVAQTRNSQETLQELILYCFTRFTDESFSTSKAIHDAVLVMSGLDVPLHEIGTSIETLVKCQKLQNNNGKLTLPLDLKLELMENVEEADKLEENVRNEWFSEVSGENPLIPLDCLWRGLKTYLSSAFRRHGIQTVSLLDPSVRIAQNGLENLSAMLDSAVENIEIEYKEIAKGLIRNFMASIGKSFCRTKYITQIADGAFNYYALAIIPEIAENFRKNLIPLTLYLDTNFLFGILDLTVNSQVDISIELMEAIKKYTLPFDLKYHQRTEKELLSSISFHRDSLRKTKWPKNISSGISKSRAISGVEFRYHQKNAVEPIDVNSYFLPFEHSDVILSEKNISKFIPTDERSTPISLLSQEYSDFLERINRDKSEILIEHDMTVLDTVRTLRTQAKNTLEAGALLITCDYTLYGFDWETSRRKGSMPCTVLPNLFWQLLRPFIPADGDFDRSFAETFAIPEFRLIGSNASITASKMASILTSYKGISEELATKLLSNDLLIGKLRDSLLDDATFQEQVELAILEEHAELEEEYSFLHQKFENSEKTNIKLSEVLANKNKELDENKLAEEKLRAELIATQAQILYSQNQSNQNENRLREEKAELERKFNEEKERNTNHIRLIIAFVISIVILGVFEILVHSLNWKWFINNQRYLGLQGCIIILVPSVLIWLIVPKYRKSSGVIGVIFTLITVVLSIIDGI